MNTINKEYQANKSTILLMEIFVNILVYMGVLKAAKSIQKSLDFILDNVMNYTTTGGDMFERTFSEFFVRSVQVVNILGRQESSSNQGTYNLENFFYTHSHYEHPNILLENENISLLGFTNEYFMFGLTEEKQQLSIDDNNNHETVVKQLNNNFIDCHQLLIVPRWSMNQLIDEFSVKNPTQRQQTIVKMSSKKCSFECC